MFLLSNKHTLGLQVKGPVYITEFLEKRDREKEKSVLYSFMYASFNGSYFRLNKSREQNRIIFDHWKTYNSCKPLEISTQQDNVCY